MTGTSIHSHEALLEGLKNSEKAYLLLYKAGSEQSECALKNLQNAKQPGENIEIFIADVNEVKDIHPNYSVTTVPAMLEFEKGQLLNILKGCHQPDFYTAVFENALYAAKVAANAEKPQKRVTVYTTPTCSWCTTLKTHLKKHGIRYTEIDVSKDEQAAREMQRKSGQMGVPQTDISGEMIVGFDKGRIDRLLEIRQ
jgi:glutaredoxin-like YruB-family protein